jgi:hypothetical protein
MNNLENILITKYRELFGIGTLQNITNLNSTLNTILIGNICITSNINTPLNTLIIGSTTIKSNLNISNNLNIFGSTTCNSMINTVNTIYQGYTSHLSNFTVSGASYLYDQTTMVSTFYSNNNFCQSISFLSNLIISNMSPLQNKVNISNNLTISGNTYINESATINSNLNILNDAILQSDSTYLSSLLINGNSLINNNMYNSYLLVSGYSMIQNISNVSNFNVEGNITVNNSINNNITSLNTLNISGYTNINNINILGQIINDIPEFTNNDSAIIGGVPLWGLYRTGGIIKIRINTLSQVITLNGNSIINLYLNDIFIDPGIINNFNYNISTIGTISTQKIGSYLLYYNALDNNNNIINTLSRIINILPYPIIISILLVTNQIIVTITGTYSIMSYSITNNNNLIINETIITTTNINVSSLISDINSYIITIYLKKYDNTLLTSGSYTFKI